MTKVLSVVGTRPNLVKMAPVVAELDRREGFEPLLVDTGQHYDRELYGVFFDELDMPAPDHLLGVGSGSHSATVAAVMRGLEPVLRTERPDLVLVPGDVDSTLGAALAAAQAGVPLGHVEAGLRSFDRSMPEELNRVLCDRAADLLFTHSPEAGGNLAREGAARERVHLVGNTMIDTLVRMRPLFDPETVAARLGVEPGAFVLVTLHRPALVDGTLLADALAGLERLARELPVVFPMHPRTRSRLPRALEPAVRLTEPLGYLDFVALESVAAAVLTDSGGVQEETTWLGVPCFTLRDNTERPVTIAEGTNTLLGLDPARIEEIPALLAARRTPGSPPRLWDGRAAERLVDVLGVVTASRGSGSSRPSRRA